MVELYPCRRVTLSSSPLPTSSTLAAKYKNCATFYARPPDLLCSVCRLMRRFFTSNFGTSGGVPTFLRQILIVYIVLYYICIPSVVAKTHWIPWVTDHDSLHGSVNDTILYVNEDDKIKFICKSTSPSLALFWSTERKQFDECRGLSLFACNDSQTFELQVTEFQWLPGMPSFQKGQPVYFFGRHFECRYHGMRLVTIYGDEPEPPKTRPAPKKTTVSDWGHPKTTALARGTPTKAEYLTLPHRPKTSAKIQRTVDPATTKLPKSVTVKKSVPILKTSRAGYASVAPYRGQYWVTVFTGLFLSVLHFFTQR